MADFVVITVGATFNERSERSMAGMASTCVRRVREAAEASSGLAVGVFGAFTEDAVDGAGEGEVRSEGGGGTEVCPVAAESVLDEAISRGGSRTPLAAATRSQ